MATVEEVILKYHELVPFPWTIRKIKKAGYKPEQLFTSVADDLNVCEDLDHNKQTARLVKNLQQAIALMTK